MMTRSNQKKVEKNELLLSIIGLLSIATLVFALSGGICSILSCIEYIEFDKTIDFSGKTFYVYKYIQETPLYTKYIITKYVCPEQIVNTTCIVTDKALICEKFSCLVYKGMVKN